MRFTFGPTASWWAVLAGLLIFTFALASRHDTWHWAFLVGVAAVAIDMCATSHAQREPAHNNPINVNASAA